MCGILRVEFEKVDVNDTSHLFSMSQQVTFDIWQFSIEQVEETVTVSIFCTFFLSLFQPHFRLTTFFFFFGFWIYIQQSPLYDHPIFRMHYVEVWN